MIAYDPLHRSGRAALPHPAPALGDDAEANKRIGMTDASGRQHRMVYRFIRLQGRR